MASNWTERRVVITGLGVVTPLGHQVDAFWKNLLAGQCGIDKNHPLRSRRSSTRQIAGEVKDFDPSPGLSLAQGNPAHGPLLAIRRLCRRGRRLSDSGLDLDQVNRDEIGVFIGSGIGGLQTTTEQLKVLLERGPDRLSPFMIPMLISNMASGLVSMYYNLRGPNFATCSACATANHAIGEAWRTIKMGDAQVMFAGGAEATIVPIGIGGFCAMRAMSTRNDDPAARLAAVRQGTRRLRHGRRRGRAGARGIGARQSSAARGFIAKSPATATPPTPIISPRRRPEAKARRAA